MIVSVLLFIVGLILLIKGGDIFVESATGIATRLGVPSFIIGSTIVSLGTTLPEVLVSVGAACGGHGEISYGNAIGSIICNTALIAAITIAVKCPRIDRSELKVSVIFFFVSAFFYVCTVYFSGQLNRLSGITLLLIFIVYMAVSVYNAKQSSIFSVENNKEMFIGTKNFILTKDVVFLIIGSIIIALGADILIESGIDISSFLGVPESVIALTFVALGTSLPELTTSITALVKGYSSLSLGNIIGANFLNIVFVSGLSALISPFELPANKTIFGYNASLILDIPLMLFVMLFMCLPAILRGKLSRIQGYILLLIYVLFCAVQFFL